MARELPEYKLTDYERETIITGNEEAGCICCFETFNKNLINKLKIVPGVKIISSKMYNGYECVKAEFPLSWIDINPKAKKIRNKKNLSDEQRKAASERMKKLQAQKKLEKLNAN